MTILLYISKIVFYLHLSLLFLCIICCLSTCISEVTKAVSRLIALALDLDADFFGQPEFLGKPIGTLRLLHYEGEDS